MDGRTRAGRGCESPNSQNVVLDFHDDWGDDHETAREILLTKCSRLKLCLVGHGFVLLCGEVEYMGSP